MLTVQPFDNTVDLVTMNGAGLRASIEAAASSLVAGDPEAYPGFGYQLSGLIVDITVEENNQGSRVTGLLIKQEDGSYEEVEDDRVSRVTPKQTELIKRIFDIFPGVQSCPAEFPCWRRGEKKPKRDARNI